ncbi:MAG: hypothetical protein K2N29_07140, partial [Ruminiclostridium sp.]|nr:hypothetical protein [Ruminiclostridium sp.]
MKNSKKIISSILAASVILGVSACNGGGGGGGRNTDTTTAPVTTTAALTTRAPLETDEKLQEIVAGKADELKLADVESVDKKIKWLAWWDIEETSAACELFKAQYGIPEEGNDSYGAEFANEIFV